MGICCVAQGTLTGDLYQPREVGWGGSWEGISKGRGYMYIYGDLRRRQWHPTPVLLPENPMDGGAW